jgi:hypothetical protein
MKRSSSIDCHSIGMSLKRVKISTSPGELRLDRDIESLISGKRWMSTANHGLGNNVYHGGASLDRRGSRIHVELHSHHARLTRDPVDPMRLRLTFLDQITSSKNINAPTDSNNAQRSTSSPLPPERWTFLIEIPRMYPHAPPSITRVTRDFVPNNENVGHLGNMNLDRQNSSASAAMVASSVMQGRVEPPAPEQIFINLLPPTLHHHPSRPQSGGLGDTQMDLATAVCNSWTPVSTLQDLIDFLIGIPARRREWWSAERDRRRNHQPNQQRFFGCHAAPAAQPTIAPGNNSFSDTHQYLPLEHQHIPHQSKKQEPYHSSQCKMDEDGEVSNFEYMMEDSQHDFSGLVRTERQVNPFTTNRFDVGYEREANIRSYWR